MNKLRLIFLRWKRRRFRKKHMPLMVFSLRVQFPEWETHYCINEASKCCDELFNYLNKKK